MNVIREIQRINEQELAQGVGLRGSWHDAYKDSAYIYIGGLPLSLTEGDVLAVFSQYGHVEQLNMPRDKDTGKQRGFAFLKYEDQRSTVLAVDNFNGIQLLGRTLRVDHAKDYRAPTATGKQQDDQHPSHPSTEETVAGSQLHLENTVVPPLQQSTHSEDQEEKDDDDDDHGGDPFLHAKRKQERKEERRKRKREKVAHELGIDLDDPMRDYLIDARLEEKKERQRSKKHRKREDGS